MTTVVVGGGVVGLCVAVALAEDGRDVTVIDAARGDVGASAINCGWSTPAHARPLPSPATAAKALRWLVRGNGPLTIRPRLDPHVVRWLLGAAWSARPGQQSRGLRAMATLAGAATPAFDAFAEAGVRVDWRPEEPMVAFVSRDDFEHEVARLEEAAALGLGQPSALSGEAAREREPSLAGGVVGAVSMGGSRVVDPVELQAALRAHLKRTGVEVSRGERVVGFERHGSSVVAVETDLRRLACSELVVAAGVWTRRLVSALGTHLPLQAGRGYSMDLPLPVDGPRHMLELGEASMVVVPLRDRLRLCGTMELARVADPPDERRTSLMLRSVGRYLQPWQPPLSPRTSVAPRPMTPDDLPVIGRIPGHSNAVVASGHGMLGLTLGPVTGRVVAELLAGREAIDLRPFAPDRFRW